jgi:hypothetical protein
MPKCHNCGRETFRTEDWACLWCGHPLLFGPFKKIEKTYKQVKEERLDKHRKEKRSLQEQKQKCASEEVVKSRQDLELIRGIEIEAEPKTEKKVTMIPDVKEKSIEETGVEKNAQESDLQILPENKAQLKQEVEPETEVDIILDEKTKKQREGMEGIQVEEVQKTGLESDQVDESIQTQEPKLELEQADIELTVEEILKAYEEDDVAADAKFINKILRVTGIISLVEIKEGLDIQFIRLTGDGDDPWQSIQCMFEKKQILALQQLEKGKTVTVQGRYNGSIIAIRMIDCILVT